MSFIDDNFDQITDLDSNLRENGIKILNNLN